MTRKTLRALITPALIVCLSTAWMGCDNDNDDDDNSYTVSATLNTAQEVPVLAVPSTGSGTLTGTYDINSNILQYNVSWQGLTAMASAAHFHGPALPGATASPVVTLTMTNNGVAGTSTGNATLTDAQEQDLLAGRWYVNVHTPNNPPGEIRGQVSATK
ncbi:MAG: CHRD domain-containing protein [Flavisolibacter sp.]